MNYLRGAISTISAPYQYYKEINPSTLTGAIDVIVIQRPAANGETELACSPFHVRFGKWQVLRPGEKKVNVSVNGHPIPFNMKIGEAGEAFFVFETDDDIPEDLITSPLLEPTTTARPSADVPTDRFAARADEGEAEAGRGEQAVDTDAQTRAEELDVQQADEPDFLDLDAQGAPPPAQQQAQSPDAPPHTEIQPQTHAEPESHLPSPPPSPTTTAMTASSLLARAAHKGDQLLHTVAAQRHGEVDTGREEKVADGPAVVEKHGVALDAEGYHLDGPVEESVEDQTAEKREGRVEHTQEASTTPTTSRIQSQASGSRQHTQDASTTPTTSRIQTQVQPPSPTTSSLPRPPPSPLTLRATSEPPPESELGAHPHVEELQQEYSWEWGAFPQPSPMTTKFPTFPRLGDLKGKRRLHAGLDEDPLVLGGGSREANDYDLRGESIDEEGDEAGLPRSRSVPPELDGSPTLQRRELPAEHAHARADVEGTSFGAGGRLTSSRRDPARFGVYIERKTVAFELSVPPAPTPLAVFGGHDELAAADAFARGQVTYARFMADAGVVDDARLVIRWAGGQYITREDASPLMGALVLWRAAALQSPAPDAELPSPMASPKLEPQREEEPVSEAEEERAVGTLKRAESEPLEASTATAGKPTSSGWSRWWSRSNTSREAEVKATRPELRGSASEEPVASKKSQISNGNQAAGGKDDPPSLIPFPSSSPPKESAVEKRIPQKRFAKTLRLTSDQLYRDDEELIAVQKALNLKSGANTITFSLSTSGVIACTARIFVWDSTDLVVVSDIDGTITNADQHLTAHRSDGLGHVFAMIGRDWTHIGVAKLYTDITRNGYKIMYLTSRAIGQADATRDYLKGIKQNDYQLPEGPVIMSPDRLIAALHREVIMRKPEVFKMACLRDIQRLFGEASRNPFYAGFGNRITDALSYRSVNVPSARIFTIDSAGEVKMELLELAGYKSSYIHMTDLVDQMFPPIHRKWAPEFTDFNYWKNPVQEYALPDLSPPSPALSARSDTSNVSTLARIRNFSLGGTRTSNVAKRQTLPAFALQDGNHKSAHLRQMSSLERLGSTIASFTTSSSSVDIPNPNAGHSRHRSLSPASRSSLSLTYADSGSEDEFGRDTSDSERQSRKRTRAKSITSMPGSLDDDMHFGMEEDDGSDAEEHPDVVDGEDGYGYEGGGEGEEDPEHEEVAEDAFDEDFFATGEMKNVPFL
ncbi:hypothetical protein HWV62_32248 [Athelia sp. TMB]|nr:hypothetical protein HWV62_32248 [Athelia sp. TMB]